MGRNPTLNQNMHAHASNTGPITLQNHILMQMHITSSWTSFYIHHSAWRRGFGVSIVNQPLQNKLILQVLLFLCYCNALTDIKWTYREIMLELKIAAYILSNLHTVRFLNSQIRIQAFALVTEPNISTRSSQSWALWLDNCSSQHSMVHCIGWVALSFFVCRLFRYGDIRLNLHLFSIYTGIKAHYYPSNTKYQAVSSFTAQYHQYRLLLTQYHQLPSSTVLYWPSTII